MARPDFTKTWASSRLSIPTISDPDYAKGFLDYLGSQPPTTDDHDYIMNLQDQRAVWLGEQMLLAVGHEWQNDVTYDEYAVVRSPVDGQLYRSLSAVNLNNEPSVSGSDWAPGVSDNADLLNSTRIDVASTSTVDLTTNAPNTRNINITGTATINGFTVAAGQNYLVRFDASLPLTNSASLVTNTGANIVTAPGDTCWIRSTATNVVEVLNYVRGDNQRRAINAWILFNGTGTVAITDSYGVSSIADLGTASYQVNFLAGVFLNTNYCVSSSATRIDASNEGRLCSVYARATSSCRVFTETGGGTPQDCTFINLQFTGGR